MPPPTTSLTEAAQEQTKLLASWKAKGGRLTSWFCPCCPASNKCTRPARADLTQGRDCWKALKTCTECGAISMVHTYPTGKTAAFRITT